MSDFMRYINAQEEKRHAYTKYSLASKELELTGIKERFYEIISQSDPIASAFPELREGEREQLIALCRYVVFGKKIDGISGVS